MVCLNVVLFVLRIVIGGGSWEHGELYGGAGEVGRGGAGWVMGLVSALVWYLPAVGWLGLPHNDDSMERCCGQCCTHIICPYKCGHLERIRLVTGGSPSPLYPKPPPSSPPRPHPQPHSLLRLRLRHNTLYTLHPDPDLDPALPPPSTFPPPPPR